LVLSVLVVCESRIFSLSLLATVRGGTSFLCPKRQRNEAKKTLLNHATLSVHSVQFSFIGAPKARCSPEPGMFEPLLLANPDTNTLRPVRSRASTIAKEPARPHPHLRLRFLVGSVSGLRWRTPVANFANHSLMCIYRFNLRLVGCMEFVRYGLTHPAASFQRRLAR
jgi:hypothetical protein